MRHLMSFDDAKFCPSTFGFDDGVGGGCVWTSLLG